MTASIVDVSTLAGWITAGRKLVVLDARASLSDAGAGRAAWQASHIPGARHADMDRELSAPPSVAGGRHPLPDKSAFAARLRAWGITPDHVVVVYPDHVVVVYDDVGGQLAAARAWWMLLWAGHPAVFVLDGGWQAWQRAGHATETSAPIVVPSDWEPGFDDALIATEADVVRGAAVVVDARRPERYRGENEPIDRVAGHIPGACNVPGASLLDDHHAFLPRAALQARLPESDDAIAYCGSGITACQIILAAAVLGRSLPRLYVGSWSAWSGDSSRPVATGDV